jgi:hypothetical protein
MNIPILLFTFTDNNRNEVCFSSWSPNGDYPLIENVSHPLQQPSYTTFFRRVLAHLGVAPITVFGSDTQYGSILNIETDYMCSIPVVERRNELYIVVLMNYCISPLFFSEEHANNFLTTRRELFQSTDAELRIRHVSHGRL